MPKIWKIEIRVVCRPTFSVTGLAFTFLQICGALLVASTLTVPIIGIVRPSHTRAYVVHTCWPLHFLCISISCACTPARMYTPHSYVLCAILNHTKSAVTHLRRMSNIQFEVLGGRGTNTRSLVAAAICAAVVYWGSVGLWLHFCTGAVIMVCMGIIRQLKSLLQLG